MLLLKHKTYLWVPDILSYVTKLSVKVTGYTDFFFILMQEILGIVILGIYKYAVHCSNEFSLRDYW